MTSFSLKVSQDAAMQTRSTYTAAYRRVLGSFFMAKRHYNPLTGPRRKTLHSLQLFLPNQEFVLLYFVINDKWLLQYAKSSQQCAKFPVFRMGKVSIARSSAFKGKQVYVSESLVEFFRAVVHAMFKGNDAWYLVLKIPEGRSYFLDLFRRR